MSSTHEGLEMSRILMHEFMSQTHKREVLGKDFAADRSLRVQNPRFVFVRIFDLCSTVFIYSRFNKNPKQKFQ